VGTLFRGVRHMHIDHVYFHIPPPSLRSRNILVMGRYVYDSPIDETSCLN
jgi:hypothetical protein